MRWLAVGALAVLAAGGAAFAATAHSRNVPVSGRIVLLALASSSLRYELLASDCKPIAAFDSTYRIERGNFAFSPRGFVAFTRQPLPARGLHVPYTEIVVRGLTAAARSHVAARVPGFSEDFAFSPDGRVLAVADGAGILVKSLRTGRSRLLRLPVAQHPWLRGYSHLSFSPDGRLLAADQASWHAGDANADRRREETIVIRVADGRTSRIYDEPLPLSYAPSPVFTSNGRGIVLVSDRHKQLVRLPVGGGRSTALTPPAGRRTFIDPYLVEPHGAGYVYARGRAPLGIPDVWRVDARGRVLRLTSSRTPPPGPDYGGPVPLALSPDGMRLLLGDVHRAELLPLAGGKPQLLCGTGGSTIVGGAWLR